MGHSQIRREETGLSGRMRKRKERGERDEEER
jgi:hypothetical protein